MPNSAHTEWHTLKTGRRVAVHRFWRGRRIVVFCHPAPGAGNFDPDPSQTGSCDVSLVAIDRPGYDGSDPIEPGGWSTPAQAADDIAEVLDAMGVKQPVGVAGWSAGGRVALALAARRPDLVDRVVAIGTPAPDEEVPWVPPEYRAALESLRGLAPAETHARLAKMLAPQRPADPYSLEALQALGGGKADDDALALPGARKRLGDMLKSAWSQGTAGVAADIAGYTLQPWGFKPSDVRADTLLIYGSADARVGPAHGSWWLKHLPRARLELVQEVGHLLVMPLWRLALAHLANTR